MPIFDRKKVSDINDLQKMHEKSSKFPESPAFPILPILDQTPNTIYSFCCFSGSSGEPPCLGESTAPAWLKLELEEAEFIPKQEAAKEEHETFVVKEEAAKNETNPFKLDLGDLQDTSKLTPNGKDITPDSRSLDFTEEGDLGLPSPTRKKKESESQKGLAPRQTDRQTSQSSNDDLNETVSQLEKSMSKQDCIKLIAELQNKVEQLETENQFLHKTVAQQLDKITRLEDRCKQFDLCKLYETL